MRVVHKGGYERITTDKNGFSVIGRVTRFGNKYNGAKLVLDMKRIQAIHGNLTTVYAAMSLTFGKSNNQLRILPRKACGTDVILTKDLFGYVSGWEKHLEDTFRCGATSVFAFGRNDFDAFKEYLLHNAFRKDWKRILPYHYKLDAKAFLMELFNNAVQHSNSHEPIFVCSAYDGNMLRFTMVDCGDGFGKQFSKVISEIDNEGQAISMAMSGYSVKNKSKATLKNLGDYCTENNGELFIVSGSASVLFDKNGFHKVVWLPGAFRGSIVNFSVKIELPEFLRQVA
jgi:hypothetical protein